LYYLFDVSVFTTSQLLIVLWTNSSWNWYELSFVKNYDLRMNKIFIIEHQIFVNEYTSKQVKQLKNTYVPVYQLYNKINLLMAPDLKYNSHYKQLKI